MLQPVKYKNTVDIAIEHIGNYITKNLNIGDVLPSERDLAAGLHVTPSYVRENNYIFHRCYLDGAKGSQELKEILQK